MPSTLTRPYCSLPDVQDIAGVNDPELDDKLLGAIDAASRMVEELCGRDFWFHEFSESGYVISRKAVIGPIALLPFEIIELTGVSVDGSAFGVDGLLYEVGGKSIESTGPWGSYPFTGKLEVFGTFGFALKMQEGAPVLDAPPATLPSTVRRATALIAAALSGEWRKERVAPDGSRESLLEVRIPAEALTLLKDWDIRKRLATF